MATFDEFYRSLPDDSGKRGEFFEKVFVPWFLKTDPEWSNKIRSLWLWDEYPNRWGKDCGIDLVYEDTAGKHWAVQSKCIAPDREINKAEIDSFLSESNDPRIHGRLLIASTDGIGKNAMQVIERQEKQVICFLREHFQQSAVEFPSTPHELASGRRKERLTPRPHQEEAIRNVVKGLETHERGQLLMACGTGKTLTSLWIKEEMGALRTLVLVPSLSLLSQTLREWTANSQNSFNWICVCSDQSVAKQDRTTDDWIEHISEIGAPVTSDPEEIRQFLQGDDGGVVFCTYQSSPLIVEVQKDIGAPTFDLAFADEAHRCAGKVSEAFGSVLDSQKIRAEKRLFMTATPRVLSSRIKTKADSEDIEVASMDDESLFGKVLHKLNFSEAIQKDLLSDYRVVVIGVDDPEIQAQIINRPLCSTGTGIETDYETLANHISLAKAIRDYDLQRVITFHSRVKGAKKFSEDHPAIVDWLPTSSKTERAIQTGYVSGEMTSLERNNKIGQLRNLEDRQVGILSNARCLSEGVDVPSLDGIAFIDPRSSQVDIIQAVGRAIRKSESKSFGYIILPVYLGDTENIGEEILASRFKDIWKVILALKSQDDSLSDILDCLRIELGQRRQEKTNDSGLSKVIFDLPEKVKNTIGDSIQTILVRNTTDSWREMYGKLLDFVDKNGHARPHHGCADIGRWIIMQRGGYSKGNLPKISIDLLEDLDGWVWDPREVDWINKYEELVRYTKGGKSPSPPVNHKVLKTWMATQRSAYSTGRMSSKHIQLLENLDGWIWDPFEFKWNQKYEDLVQYTKEYGDSRPPRRHKTLGTWVDNQKSVYKKGKLSKERTDLLENLAGWVWDSYDFEWEKQYQHLVQYTKENGDARPPQGHEILGSWVNKQRSVYNKGRLPKERIDLLEDLAGWVWDPFDFDWDKKYQDLVQYIKENGHVRVFKRNNIFGKWINKQRSVYSKGKLSNERIDLLEDLNGWVWNQRDFDWTCKYQELVRYTNENGSASPLRSHETLGKWVNHTRSAYRSGSLPENRIQLLECLDGWVWCVK